MSTPTLTPCQRHRKSILLMQAILTIYHLTGRLPQNTEELLNAVRLGT